MSNVTIFVPTLLKGGAEKQSLLLAKTLQDHHHVTLVVFKDLMDDQNQQFVLDNEIRCIRLKGNLVSRMAGFYKQMKRNRTDVIFAYLASCNFVAATVGRLAGIPLVFGGIRSSVLAPHKMLVQKFLHNYFFDRSVANNYYGVKNLTAKGFKASKFVVIPNYIELNKSKTLRSDSEIIRVLSVGRFVPSKDYYTCLLGIKQLIRQLDESELPLRYRIIGYGPLEENIRNWITELELGDVVELILNPGNTDQYYANSDVFLSCSVFEGLSNAIMEAMSYALPIVATDVGDNNRLVRDGVNGFLVKPKDYQEIAGKLKLLMEDKTLRTGFGDNGYEVIRNNYGLDNFRNAYLNLISCQDKQI
jgi:glycosyltransferase involved in cell wall biosynthesis